MGATMAQFRIPFPGENEHTDRLLRTAGFLISRGRLAAACDVLDMLDPRALEPDELELFIALAEDALQAARAEKALRVIQPVAPSDRGRVLAFRPASTFAASRPSVSSR